MYARILLCTVSSGAPGIWVQGQPKRFFQDRFNKRWRPLLPCIKFLTRTYVVYGGDDGRQVGRTQHGAKGSEKNTKTKNGRQCAEPVALSSGYVHMGYTTSTDKENIEYLITIVTPTDIILFQLRLQILVIRTTNNARPLDSTYNIYYNIIHTAIVQIIIMRARTIHDGR